ncbi:hypothetical protein CCH79_00007109 [Gambusia affinis]|uniref:AAA+ ATPase domain-containing protein n=1 Tax=Gambusia affinis TaxID=33528 RepID=A0A315VDP3_GAMAF|nr:hypothetical protein CCH79_00007109 [Gambusia affinis]
MSKSCDLLSAAENAPPGAPIRQVNSRTEIFISLFSMNYCINAALLSSYNQVWKDAMSELSNLLSEELPPEPPPPQRDRVVFFQRLATLYVRYVQVFRRLEEAHNMLVHPQKRRLILLLLKGVMGRVLELKYEMVEKEFSEYHYVDDILHALKLTPVKLVQQGLLKRAKNFRMQDFLGDYNYLGTTLRQNDIEPMPSLLDVRQVLSLYGILPLGASEVHEKAPLIKSILLVGPAGVGKSMLVHAICQETGATLFDLSPYTIAGKYPGKPGLAMMLHMVFKVARLLQPSVIWIGDAEKMFYKKVPKEEEQLEPRRLKKDFPKCLKLIKPEDRVLIIGTTKSPQNSDIKGMCKLYGKIILIPRPDYGSRYILWEKLIKKQGGKITNALDLTSLTKVTDGYTPGHMVQVISSVVTKDRINDLTKQPLTADDFIVPLAKFEPVLQKDEEAIKNWYAKTPLGKRRIKAAAEKEEALLKAKDAKNKKKK